MSFFFSSPNISSFITPIRGDKIFFYLSIGDLREKKKFKDKKKIFSTKKKIFFFASKPFLTDFKTILRVKKKKIRFFGGGEICLRKVKNFKI